MNSFGAASALMIHMSQSPELSETPAMSELSAALAANGTVGLSAAGNATANAVSTGLLDDESPAEINPLGIAVLLSCIVARGVLGSSVLKNLDSIAKGLIDVTAIVLCTVIQIGVEGLESA